MESCMSYVLRPGEKSQLEIAMQVSSAEVMKVGEIIIEQKIQRENKGQGRTSEMRPGAVREQGGRNRREVVFLRSQRSSCFDAPR